MKTITEKMTAIEKIVCKLKRYPATRYSIDGDTITVEAADRNGFSVWLTEKNPRYTVGYDGWHDEFDEEKEALSAFAFGLSEDCRLKVVQRGDFECEWTVESRNGDGRWSGDSATGLLFAAFWRKRTILYRQNHLITKTSE